MGAVRATSNVHMPHRVTIRVPAAQDRGSDFLRALEWIETSEPMRGAYSMMSANDGPVIVYTYCFSDADSAFLFKLAFG